MVEQASSRPRSAASASIAVTRPDAIVAPTIASSTVAGGRSSAV